MRGFPRFPRLRPHSVTVAVLGAALVCIAFLSFLATSASLSATGADGDKDKKSPAKCCKLGIEYLSGTGSVILERICKETGKTSFHFRTVNMTGACTYGPATVLRDQSGRRYKWISHSGLPDCRRGARSSQPNVKFEWVFEGLAPGVSSINLVEEEDDVTADLSYWAWRNVSIKQCNF